MNVLRFIEEMFNRGLDGPEVAILAAVWLGGFAYWLADERVREMLWRGLP